MTTTGTAKVYFQGELVFEGRVVDFLPTNVGFPYICFADKIGRYRSYGGESLQWEYLNDPPESK